jgi:hypothetical protein
MVYIGIVTNNDVDYPIRLVLSSYWWQGDSEGIPDGKSDCDLCEVMLERVIKKNIYRGRVEGEHNSLSLNLHLHPLFLVSYTINIQFSNI